MIEVENLVKSFSVSQKQPGLIGSIKSLVSRKFMTKEALKGVNLRIDAGEIVGLVGANGAGKTTLVKILSGIVHPTSGSAKVLGFTPWERKTEFKKQIALLMGQKAQLWWDLPAADCFLLLREIYQVPRQEFQKSLNELVDTLQVGNELNTPIRRLSLGERMKMELIASLVHRPSVVFLDEPTIGLDMSAQRAIRNFLLDYQKRHQPAMILTSHYMEDISTLCKRIVIIRDGQFVFDGPLAQIQNTHARNKTIVAQLDPDHGDAKSAAQYLEVVRQKKGMVLEHTPSLLRVEADKDVALELSSVILKHFPVFDLTIQDEDISRVIESMMRKRGQA